MTQPKATCLSLDCPERHGGECMYTLHPEVWIEPAGSGYFIIVKDELTENRLAVTLEELSMLYGKLTELLDSDEMM